MTGPLSAARRRVVLAGLMLGLFLAALDVLIVATAVPAIAGDLGNLGQVAWVFTAYLLTFTTSMPLYGKLGDLYGRKRVFQAAIVVFVGASVLAGASGSMLQLIVARTLQGVGGGGLVTLTTAIMGDIVTPRERGRYVGYTSGVWAVSSLLGPLAGGFLVDHASWRWIFFLNLPTGLAALALIGLGFAVPQRRVEHRVDYLGAGLIVAGVACLLLVTTWGGNEYPWGSPTIVGLGAAGIGLAALVLRVERRAAEPVLPLHLFRNDVVRVCAITTFLVGAANFGMAILVPLFLQVVNGADATSSGLLLMPVSVGITIASTLVGRRVVRTGRYRHYPAVGAAVFCVGLFLLTTMDQATPRALQWSFTFVVGVGLGMSTPIVVLAVQNAVRYRELGASTALATFSRSMGQAFGSALLGTVMATRLTHHLAALVPGSGLSAGRLRSRPDVIRSLANPVRHAVIEAFRLAIRDAFVVAIPIGLAGVVAALFLRHVPLRESIGDGDDEAIVAVPGHVGGEVVPELAH